MQSSSCDLQSPKGYVNRHWHHTLQLPYGLHSFDARLASDQITSTHAGGVLLSFPQPAVLVSNVS